MTGGKTVPVKALRMARMPSTMEAVAKELPGCLVGGV